MGITVKPKRGEIWYIENDCNFTGREVGYTRPAIIVSNDTNNKFSNVFEVVYLTTNRKKNNLPTHVRITSAPRVSIAQCEQVYSVSVERLKDKCGTLTPKEQNAIDKAILVSLGINAERNETSLERELEMYKRMYNDILERLTSK